MIHTGTPQSHMVALVRVLSIVSSLSCAVLRSLTLRRFCSASWIFVGILERSVLSQLKTLRSHLRLGEPGESSRLSRLFAPSEFDAEFELELLHGHAHERLQAGDVPADVHAYNTVVCKSTERSI